MKIHSQMCNEAKALNDAIYSVMPPWSLLEHPQKLFKAWKA
jgi:hypothetical protein